MTREAHQIPKLDTAGLKRFGLTMAGVIAVPFGLLLPFLFSYRFPIWPWPVAGVFLVWALAAPGSLNEVYRPWMRLGLALNRVVTPIIMGLVFFVVITPASFIMRIIGRDPMARRFDPDASTYRQPKQKSPKEKLERPY